MCCVALTCFVCLTLLASFFLPSSSLIKICKCDCNSRCDGHTENKAAVPVHLQAASMAAGTAGRVLQHHGKLQAWGQVLLLTTTQQMKHLQYCEGRSGGGGGGGRRGSDNG